MAQIFNPSADDLNGPDYFSIKAGETKEVSDEVAALFADHPILKVVVPAPPAQTPPVEGVPEQPPAVPEPPKEQA